MVDSMEDRSSHPPTNPSSPLAHQCSVSNSRFERLNYFWMPLGTFIGVLSAVALACIILGKELKILSELQRRKELRRRQRRRDTAAIGAETATARQARERRRQQRMQNFNVDLIWDAWYPWTLVVAELAYVVVIAFCLLSTLMSCVAVKFFSEQTNQDIFCFATMFILCSIMTRICLYCFRNPCKMTIDNPDFYLG